MLNSSDAKAFYLFSISIIVYVPQIKARTSKKIQGSNINKYV